MNFEHAQTILIEAKESDIRILVQEKINEDRDKDPDLMDEKLEREILRIISALAHGMFVITKYTKYLHTVNYAIDFFYLRCIFVMSSTNETSETAEKPSRISHAILTMHLVLQWKGFNNSNLLGLNKPKKSSHGLI
jgi:hypothetical protein